MFTAITIAMRFISACPPGEKAKMIESRSKCVICDTINAKTAVTTNRIIKYPKVLNIVVAISLNGTPLKTKPTDVPSMI